MNSNNRKQEAPSWLLRLGKSNSLIRLAEILTDFTSVFTAIIGAYGLYILLMRHSLPEGVFYYCKLGAVAGIITTITFYYTGLYHHKASMMNLVETRQVLRTVFTLFLVLILFTFFSRTPYSRIVLFLSFGLVIFFLITTRFFFFKLYQYLYLHGIGKRRVLIFGTGAAGRLLFQSIVHTPKLGIHPVGFFDSCIEDSDDRAKKIKQLYPTDKEILWLKDGTECLEYLQHNRVDDIIISNPLLNQQHHSGTDNEIQQLLIICRRQKIHIHSVPYMQNILAQQITLHNINGIPLVSYDEIPDKAVQQFAKRCFDLLLTTLLLLPALPIMVFISIMIKFDTPGSILFRQERIGKDGKPFFIYKFRTMHHGVPDSQNSPTGKNDARLTNIGKLLRRSSLDELPQLINVLLGDMSLVGPRPEMRFIVENEYNDIHRQRLQVKPGITGIWQISVDRTREIHEDISYDLFYVANSSFLLDVLILIRTVPALFLMRTF